MDTKQALLIGSLNANYSYGPCDIKVALLHGGMLLNDEVYTSQYWGSFLLRHRKKAFMELVSDGLINGCHHDDKYIVEITTKGKRKLLPSKFFSFGIVNSLDMETFEMSCVFDTFSKQHSLMGVIAVKLNTSASSVQLSKQIGCLNVTHNNHTITIPSDILCGKEWKQQLSNYIDTVRNISDQIA